MEVSGFPNSLFKVALFLLCSSEVLGEFADSLSFLLGLSFLTLTSTLGLFAFSEVSPEESTLTFFGLQSDSGSLSPTGSFLLDPSRNRHPEGPPT